MVINHLIRVLESSIGTHFSVISTLLVQSFQARHSATILSTAGVLVGIFWQQS